MKSILASLALAVVLAAPLAHAGREVIEPKSTPPPFSPFDAGNREFQLGVGAFFSLNNGGTKRPALNDVDLMLRYGWMLNSPSGAGAFRGNFEFLLDAGVGAIFEGPGDVLAELALLLRYNFVQEGAVWVPYFQIGAGGEYSNASSSDSEQRLLGSEFLFNLQAAFGLRYMFSDRCAGFIEAGYRHVSNASLADRNLGLNSLGGLLGFSCFF